VILLIVLIPLGIIWCMHLPYAVFLTPNNSSERMSIYEEKSYSIFPVIRSSLQYYRIRWGAANCYNQELSFSGRHGERHHLHSRITHYRCQRNSLRSCQAHLSVRCLSLHQQHHVAFSWVWRQSPTDDV
jgi:hypothetical protein